MNLLVQLFLAMSQIVLARGIKTVESELITTMLEDYDAKALPRLNRSEFVQVNHSMELMKVYEVDTALQIINLRFWIQQTWRDELLVWNVSHYDNISQIYVGVGDVWQPVTILENNAELWEENFQRITHVVVSMVNDPEMNYSTVIMYYPTSLKLSCQMDVRWFPWDVHTCRLLFYSAVFYTQHVKYFPGPSKLQLTNFAPHNQWTVLNFSVNETGDDCSNQDGGCTSFITYIVVIKRKALFYVINLVAPCVVINVICILGIFTTSSSFGERLEKVTMGITALLSLSVFLLIIDDHIPVTSTQIPFMTWFLAGNFGLLVTAIISSVFVMRIAVHKVRRDPMRWYHELMLAVVTCNVKRHFRTSPTAAGAKHCDASANGHMNAKFAFSYPYRGPEGPDDLEIMQWEKLEDSLEWVFFTFFMSLQALIVAIFLGVGYANN